MKDDIEGASKKEKTVTTLPLQSKLAHLLAVVVSGVIALFVAAVLADGRSVIVLKEVKDLPRLTEPELVSKGLDYRADELLGPTYGVGLHHDSSGYTWNEAGAGDNLQTYINVSHRRLLTPSIMPSTAFRHQEHCAHVLKPASTAHVLKPAIDVTFQELGLLQVIAAVPSVIATDGDACASRMCFSCSDMWRWSGRHLSGRSGRRRSGLWRSGRQRSGRRWSVRRRSGRCPSKGRWSL